MNREIQIFVGPNCRNNDKWQTKRTTWEAFLAKFKDPVRSVETLAEFNRLPKSKQTDKKDVGGFVGGPCEGNCRKKDAVKGRDLITLDMDSIPNGQTEAVMEKVELLNCEAMIYSTRKHTSAKPRLRLVIPTSRTVEPEAYEPLARLIAQRIGIISYCDPTTFQANRLMFYPSLSADSSYVFKRFEGEFLNSDLVLTDFNWKDCTNWPTVPGESARTEREAVIQQDPETKTGWVGAFCRIYDIDSAIEKFLPTTYTKSGSNRYTYCKGSTFGGAVTYQHSKFLYSHHATDPCCNRLVNAFDLVRIHLFGDLDEGFDENTSSDKLPSYKTMCLKLAKEDTSVAALQATEQANNIAIAFGKVDVPEWQLSPSDEEALGGRTKNGGFASTITNFKYIMTNDPRLAGHIAIDEFLGQMVAKKGIPVWDTDNETRLWADVDDARLAMYFESSYNMKHQSNLLQATLIVANENKFNSVKEYLESLVWDGLNRIDDLLYTYLGAEKNEYTRQVMRVSLVGAVSRAIIGGTKWDYVPILVGPQGVGKSTFLARLGGKWFSDSLQSFDGKEASELLRGIWINELPELAAFGRSETNKIKQFLTKLDDIYRPAYGRRTEKHPRHCVFFGSTNDDEFLRDPTGDRRYWPIRLVSDPELPISAFTPDVADQVWAEAYTLWKEGTIGYELTGEAAEIAVVEQKRHHLTDDWEGVIRSYLDTDISDDWDKRDIALRRAWILDTGKSPTGIKLQRVSIIEIWCEAFGGDIAKLTKVDRSRIAAIMRNLTDWESVSAIRTKYAGVQRGYARKSC